MRNLLFFALVGIFCTFLQPLPTQGSPVFQMTGEHPNYVVIGAFRFHKNAIRFTNHAKDQNMKAKYEMNPNRNLYYVYVLSTPDRDVAIAEALRLRDASEYKDTWVFSGPLGKLKPGQVPSASGVDINPATERTIENVSTDDQHETPVENNAALASLNPTPVTDNTTASISTSAMPAQTDSNVPDEGIEGKKFFFKLFRGMDQQVVEGDVDVIDPEKLKKMGTYKGNMDVKISTPSGNTGNVSLVCEVFGYRKVQRDVNYTAPEGDGIGMSETGSVMIPFELVRLQKGDIAVMYNVYFYKDAAIMRPESRYEVNSLLEMLRENPNYKIRIHGHTNGKASGRIIYSEEGNTNFFSLNNTKDGYGSAKKLSEERAAVIRSFLTSNGVDGARMQVKAWGGKRPVHDKHSTRAQENVRVEVEILED